MEDRQTSEADMGDRPGDGLWDQMASLPALLRDDVWPLEARLRLVLTTPEIYGLRRIVLLGSGDSHAAALAMADAVAQWTGLPVEAATAMQAGRYLADRLGPRPDGILVLAVSNSGEVARVVEAAQRLRKRGALTLAITANPGSRLGVAAGRSIDVTIAPSRPAPGVRSYVASLLGIALLAIRIAEVKMRITMDAAQALRAGLAALASPLEAALERSRAVLPGMVRLWADFIAADVIGNGSEAGTAAYAAAKLLEAVGIHAVHQDVEEFFHLQYFVARANQTPAILFWPEASLAASRLEELVKTLDALRRPLLVVTSAATGLSGPGVVALPEVPPAFAPILHVVPAAALAAEWANAAGTKPFRGMEGPWAAARGSALVRDSALLA